MLKNLKNSVFIGFAIGAILPALLMLITWYFTQVVFKFEKIGFFLILCVGVNAVSLQYFFKLNKENIGKGILSATFIWAVWFLYYKTL
ncbi:MAG: stationary phase survival protein SurE [Sphingobacteriaceae bacterium]|nr:stationary phase survival protein SurE [Sphingobacteriaceae bacterium]